MPRGQHFTISRIKGLFRKAGADPGIFQRGGPNLTPYAETVLQLITSTPRQFSVNALHSIASASSTVSNRLKEQGYRLSHRHIAESNCF